MFFSTVFVAFVFFLNTLSVSAGESCSSLLERKEWRTLLDSEKADYITAVKCLQSRPAQNPSIPAAKSRFDEFIALHITLATNIHLVGQFLPWHRQFIRMYENALRTECEYKGTQPYWNWSLDSDNGALIRNSPVYDPFTGFGGDGVPGTYIVPTDPTPTNESRLIPSLYTGCVGDGPFKDYRCSIGPGLLITEHCLARGISEFLSNLLTSESVAKAMILPDFGQFRLEVEGIPITNPKMHDAGHVVIGGDMSNFFSSPTDPLFYLHHSNLDRIWDTWQQQDPARYFDVSGPSSVDDPFTNITLAFPLNMGSVGPTEPISTIMDIRSEPSCYTYV